MKPLTASANRAVWTAAMILATWASSAAWAESPATQPTNSATTTTKPSSEETRRRMIPFKCTTCGTVREVSIGTLQDMRTRGEFENVRQYDPLIIDCPKCGTKTAKQAIECPDCHEIFVIKTDPVKGVYDDTCPKCGISYAVAWRKRLGVASQPAMTTLPAVPATNKKIRLQLCQFAVSIHEAPILEQVLAQGKTSKLTSGESVVILDDNQRKALDAATQQCKTSACVWFPPIVSENNQLGWIGLQADDIDLNNLEGTGKSIVRVPADMFAPKFQCQPALSSDGSNIDVRFGFWSRWLKEVHYGPRGSSNNRIGNIYGRIAMTDLQVTIPTGQVAVLHAPIDRVRLIGATVARSALGNELTYTLKEEVLPPMPDMVVLLTIEAKAIDKDANAQPSR